MNHLEQCQSQARGSDARSQDKVVGDDAVLDLLQLMFFFVQTTEKRKKDRMT